MPSMLSPLLALLLAAVPPCLEPAACTPDITAEMDEGDGLINLGKVSDDLYRSGQPIKRSGVDGYRTLQRMGIRTVINLRTLPGTELTVIAELNARTADPSRRIYFLHLPINPFSTDVAYLNARLETILKAIEQAPKPVLVHCRYGQDRTGFVVAVYQMLHCGFSLEKALRAMELCHYKPHLGARHFRNFLEWWTKYRLPVLLRERGAAATPPDGTPGSPASSGPAPPTPPPGPAVRP
jgi:protein tyrosine phosphatase (PTP) superfamily phosphohydrolase (DUF442 family)